MMNTSISSSASTASAYFAGLGTVGFGTNPPAQPATPIQQGRSKNSARKVGAESGQKAVTIDNESRELLKQISIDFMMFTGASAPMAYHIEDGDKMSKEGFVIYCDKHYGNVYFINETGAEVDRASAGDIWWKWSDPSRRVVRRIVMEPTSAPEHEGNPEVFNRWYALRKTMAIPDYDATKEDAAPFISHLMQISDGDQIGVMYFLNWLATLYQFPDVKIPVAILMYSQYGGVGKNLVQRLLARVFGDPLVAGVSGKRMQSNFMDAIEHKRIIIINELARSDRADGYEDFKTQISESKTQFEGKGRAAREVRNIAHYIITTNNIDALPLMQNDRRIAVLMTVSQPLAPSYYDGFVKWIDGPGAGIVANLLRTWQFPADWNPHAPAPQTEAALAVQRESRGALHGLVERAIETDYRDLDLVTSEGVAITVATKYGAILDKRPSPGAVGKELKALYGKSEQKDIKRPGQPLERKVRFYVVRHAEQWGRASPEDRGTHLETGKRPFAVQSTEGADHE